MRDTLCREGQLHKPSLEQRANQSLTFLWWSGVIVDGDRTPCLRVF